MHTLIFGPCTVPMYCGLKALWVIKAESDRAAERGREARMSTLKINVIALPLDPLSGIAFCELIKANAIALPFPLLAGMGLLAAFMKPGPMHDTRLSRLT